MGKMRKGILFTLSVLLLGSALLYLSATLSAYSFSLKDNSQTLNEFEKINAQFDACSYGMKSLFEKEAIRITRQENNLTFEVDITGIANQNYTRDVRRFRQFIESYGRVNITVNDVEARRPTMYVYPQKMKVDCPPGRIEFVPQNTTEGQDAVEGYNVLIAISQPTPTVNWTQLSEVSPGNDSLYFHIGLQGSDGALSETRYLSRNNMSELQLQNEHGHSIITIEVGDSSSLVVHYNLDIYLNAVVVLDEHGPVELGSDIVNVSMGERGEKTGKVIVVEG